MILKKLTNSGGTVGYVLLALAFLSILITADKIVTYFILHKQIKSNKIINSNAFSSQKNRTKLLELISEIAPAIGFLGTVIGIIAAFKSLSVSENISLKNVSQGMYTALYTTEAGLIISISDYVFSRLFVFIEKKLLFQNSENKLKSKEINHENKSR